MAISINQRPKLLALKRNLYKTEKAMAHGNYSKRILAMREQFLILIKEITGE